MVVPAVASTAAALGGAARWAEYLPAGLMQAATVTGSESVLSVSPSVASLGLLLWAVAVSAGGWLAFRRAN